MLNNHDGQLCPSTHMPQAFNHEVLAGSVGVANPTRLPPRPPPENHILDVLKCRCCVAHAERLSVHKEDLDSGDEPAAMTWKQRFVCLLRGGGTVSRVGAPTIPTLPQPYRHSLNNTNRPSTIPTIPQRYQHSLNCTNHPSTIPTLPQLYPPSLNHTNPPSTTPTIPQLYKPSINYTDPPWTIPTLPQLYQPSINYTVPPSTIPTVPQLYQPSLNNTNHPSTIPTIPQLYSTKLIVLDFL